MDPGIQMLYNFYISQNIVLSFFQAFKTIKTILSSVAIQKLAVAQDILLIVHCPFNQDFDCVQSRQLKC